MGTLSVDNIEERSTGKGQNVLSGQAKVWSNLNGTGTIAERDSFNISGYVDNGTGNYTYSYASAMSSADYGWQASNSHPNMGYARLSGNYQGTDPTSSSYPMRTAWANAGATFEDLQQVILTIDGDLA